MFTYAFSQDEWKHELTQGIENNNLMKNLYCVFVV